MAHCIKSKEGCLPFTQAAQVEILNIKIELQNDMVEDNDPLQSMSKSA